MKLAFISFEYPPDTAYGGIATYVSQAARMMRQRGHHVEVFTSSPSRSGTDQVAGIVVHRVNETNLVRFGEVIGPVFAARHSEVQFDVVEGPEYHADARAAVRLVPDIPLVVKLHTPSAFLLELNYYEPSFTKRLRYFLGALLRGSRPTWGYDADGEGYRAHVAVIAPSERSHALDADEVVSPSRSLGDRLTREWRLDPASVVTIPYPFVPSDELLRIPVDTRMDVVTFVGRLEARKGVLDLARAIPSILGRVPGVRFRFVGAAESSPKPGMDMRQFLSQALGEYAPSIEFTGPVAPDRIAGILASTDICVFPSRWENFPFVCLEAMAAARGIVGSSAGGMSEMLDGGGVGRLVPPRSPSRIADAVVELLVDPAFRMRLGGASRERVLAEYNVDRIGALREASYARAIERRRARGPRNSA